MNFGITANIDLSAFQALEEIAGRLESRLAKAVETSGNQLVAEWSKEARIALKNPSGYVLKIAEGSHYPFNNNPLHFVIENEHPAVVFLEEGTVAFDMKRMLYTSAHVKIGKGGKRYMSIPFGHSVDSLKSAGIDPRELTQMAPSVKRERANPQDPRRYIWGDRLTDMGDVGKRRKYFSVLEAPRSRFPQKSNAPAMGLGSQHPSATTIDYTWKSSPYENIVRFQTNHGSSYMSFRTISENSDPDSWIHPSIRATHIAETAFRAIEPQFKAAVQEVIPQIAKEAFATLGLKITA